MPVGKFSEYAAGFQVLGHHQLGVPDAVLQAVVAKNEPSEVVQLFVCFELGSEGPGGYGHPGQLLDDLLLGAGHVVDLPASFRDLDVVRIFLVWPVNTYWVACSS